MSGAPEHPATRRALVLGATGLVGSRCLAHLRSSSTYDRITCLVRRPGALASADGRVQEKVVDFEALEERDLGAAEDVLCAIGSTMKKAGSREAFRAVDHDLPLRVAELALARGAARFALVSSAGADRRATSFYLRTKGELEDALAKLPWSALHVLRPSFLLGNRAESRPGEAIGMAIARAGRGLLVGGLRRWRPIDVDLVARGMVAAMVGPDPADRVVFYEHDAIVELAKRL